MNFEKRDYNKYLSIYPDKIEAYLEIAGVYKRNDETDKAKKNYEKVLVIDPNNIDAFTSLIASF